MNCFNIRIIQDHLCTKLTSYMITLEQKNFRENIFNLNSFHYNFSLSFQWCLSRMVHSWKACSISSVMKSSGVSILANNSFDAGEGIFQLWGSMPCSLLMPWLLSLPSSTSRHGIGCVGQTTCIVVPELISSPWVKPMYILTLLMLEMAYLVNSVACLLMPWRLSRQDISRHDIASIG